MFPNPPEKSNISGKVNDSNETGLVLHALSSNSSRRSSVSPDTISLPTSASPQTISSPTTSFSELHSNSKSASTKFFTSQISVTTEAYTISSTATCPPNMDYSNCSNCQATCEFPQVNVGCYSNCSEGCICANGFIQQGPHDCVPPSECACFVYEGFILAEGTEDYVNENCTQRCNCSNSQLHCDGNYQCNLRAECELREGVRRCYCVNGYFGDGETCGHYSDCADAYVSGHREDGTYPILPTGWPDQPFNVSCDMATGEGWTVFQRRRDDSVSFYHDWNDYKNGFGFLDDNFWLGNEKLFYLSNQKDYELRIEIHGPNLGATYAAYKLFRVGSESSHYMLSELGEFSGSIGHDYMSFHRHGVFSTFDNDHDDEPNSNCALLYKGGWWYKDCYDANLNGVYGLSNDWKGICLYNRQTKAGIFDITFVEMKLKPITQ